jgi:integrase
MKCSPRSVDEISNLLAFRGRLSGRLPRSWGEGYGPGEHVACDETGQPYHPDLLTSRWRRMLDELGIKRVRLHDARHSCATLMHLRQVPIAVIAAWLGHASAAFTMSVYAHSQDDALKAAASSFSRVDDNS